MSDIPEKVSRRGKWFLTWEQRLNAALSLASVLLYTGARWTLHVLRGIGVQIHQMVGDGLEPGGHVAEVVALARDMNALGFRVCVLASCGLAVAVIAMGVYRRRFYLALPGLLLNGYIVIFHFLFPASLTV